MSSLGCSSGVHVAQYTVNLIYHLTTHNSTWSRHRKQDVGNKTGNQKTHNRYDWNKKHWCTPGNLSRPSAGQVWKLQPVSPAFSKKCVGSWKAGVFVLKTPYTCLHYSQQMQNWKCVNLGHTLSSASRETTCISEELMSKCHNAEFVRRVILSSPQDTSPCLSIYQTMPLHITLIHKP